MEELSFNNILGEDEIDTLFTEPENNEAQDEPNESGENNISSNEKDNNEKNKTTEVIDPETMFEEETPESVGSGKDLEGKEGDTIPGEDKNGTSPNENFYSSIANALAVDGIFPNLDDETVKQAVDAETFSNLIESEVNARLDDKQRRIAKALENGIEPTDIRKYEGTLRYINGITDAALSEESDNGEKLRYQLIYQDFLNKGYDNNEAKKFTDRSVNTGTDVEDAKEALVRNKKYFTNAYNQLLMEAQEQANIERANRANQAKMLQKSLLKDKQLFGDMEINQDIRKKAFEVLAKPIYKDPETGEYMTAIQKYETEHRADFLKYTGLIFALTDGFKDFDSFTKGKVKKEMKKGLKTLEQTLNNTRRNEDGSLKLVTNQRDDPNSFISKGIKLDI